MQAWRDAGESWLAINSRIVSVCSDNYLSDCQYQRAPSYVSTDV